MNSPTGLGESVMLRPRYLLSCILAALCMLAVSTVSAQTNDFAGRWVLALNSGQNTDYAELEILREDNQWQLFIDGGPVNLLSQDENKIAFDLDWTDGLDRLHVTELSGELTGERMNGEMIENGERAGTWSAEPWAAYPEVGADPAPVDFSGIWSSVSRGTHKDTFDLTSAGTKINDAYDRTLDDPHLRCVSGGVIRIEDGPFNYEIIDQGDYLLILYEYFDETRRIWVDGRSFPEDIEYAYLTMGYSIGHWEGSTLVVETRGMKPTIWDAAGMPVSASGVLIERKYLDEADRLHTDYVLNDPANYTRPVYRHAYRVQRPGAGLEEYACDPHTFYRSLQLEGRLEEYWQSSDRF